MSSCQGLLPYNKTSNRALLKSVNSSQYIDQMKVALAEIGVRNVLLIAAAAYAETGLSHCYDEYPASDKCRAQSHPSCNGGSVLAGGWDGTCEQGGVGILQYDSGTITETVQNFGDRVLTVEGAVKFYPEFFSNKIRERIGLRLPYADLINQLKDYSTSEAFIAWINSITVHEIENRSENYNLWLRAMSCLYNGACDGSKSERYHTAVMNLMRSYGGYSFFDSIDREVIINTMARSFSSKSKDVTLSNCWRNGYWKMSVYKGAQIWGEFTSDFSRNQINPLLIGQDHLSYTECIRGAIDDLAHHSYDLANFHPELGRGNYPMEESDATYYTVVFEQWINFSGPSYEVRFDYPLFYAAKNGHANAKLFVDGMFVDIINIAGEEGKPVNRSAILTFKNYGWHKIAIKYIVHREHNKIDNNAKLSFEIEPRL